MASSSTHESNSWQIFDKARNMASKLVDQSKTVGNILKSTANAAGNKWNETSKTTKVGVIGLATAAVAPLAILPVLGAVGFTSAGVAAGSIAASMQTATTVSGSVFALCQSAAATGAVALSTSVGVGLGAGATAGGIAAAVCRENSDNKNNGNNGNNGPVEPDEEEDVHETCNEQCASSEENVKYTLHLKLSTY